MEMMIPEIDKNVNIEIGSFSNISRLKKRGRKDDKRFKEFSLKIGNVNDNKLNENKNFFSINSPKDIKTKKVIIQYKSKDPKWFT